MMMVKFAKYLTNINGQEYLANYRVVTATQLAARVVAVAESIGMDRLRAAAVNSYGELGESFISLVQEFKEQRI